VVRATATRRMRRRPAAGASTSANPPATGEGLSFCSFIYLFIYLFLI